MCVSVSVWLGCGRGLQASGSSSQQAPGAHASALGDNIEVQIQQLLQYEDDKVALAAQVYTTVDSHIQALDNNLAALKAELEKEQALLGADGGKGRSKADGQKKKKQKAAQDPARGAGVASVPMQAAGRGAGAGVPVDNTDPVLLPDLVGNVFDSNEPVYCYCKKVSYGEMIGCDNEDCPIEWFHYGCVGIHPDDVPETWYCNECQKLKDAGKL
mmetsp:Transcript_32695/g.92753  ORF Transcript_32695/g.92753 Transcript_32695/m.92753 type:complete len:214 (-) Transcript_32695:53-694(-)